jgi:hypothetical protein
VRTELTRTYPVPLKKGFDYIDDFRMWPDWYVGLTHLIEPNMGAWNGPGDEVRFESKLLGRRIEGRCVLDEKIEGELARYHVVVPNLPIVYFTWHYTGAGPEAFTAKVEMETEEPTSFFGKTIDRTLLPRVLERDLKRSMENLTDIFEAHMFE